MEGSRYPPMIEDAGNTGKEQLGDGQGNSEEQ